MHFVDFFGKPIKASTSTPVAKSAAPALPVATTKAQAPTSNVKPTAKPAAAPTRKAAAGMVELSEVAYTAMRDELSTLRTKATGWNAVETALKEENKALADSVSSLTQEVASLKAKLNVYLMDPTTVTQKAEGPGKMSASAFKADLQRRANGLQPIPAVAPRNHRLQI